MQPPKPGDTHSNLTRILLKPSIQILIALMPLLLYLSQFVILGQDTYLSTLDHLDFHIPNMRAMVLEGLAFAPSSHPVHLIMGGLPRVSLGSEFSLWVLLYHLFEPFTALALGTAAIHLVAFWGMYRLLRSHVLTSNIHRPIALGVACCFSLLPFLLAAGLSTAGLPLAASAFLSIRKTKGWGREIFILLAIPFFSSLFLSFAFLFAVACLWLYDLIKKRGVNFWFLAAIGLMSLAYLFVEYRYLVAAITPPFTPHRVEFATATISFSQSLAQAWAQFRLGHHHAPSLHNTVIAASIGGALLLSILEKKPHARLRAIVFLLIVNVAISCLYGFWHWSTFDSWRQDTLLFGETSFQGDRFYFLQSLTWYILFALSLRHIYDALPRFGLVVVLALVITQTGYAFHRSDFAKQWRKHGPSYREFYAESLFAKARLFLEGTGRPFRVACIGFDPGVAYYNAIPTVDGYEPYYPLAYKHKLRRVITDELDKDTSLRAYFDTWGSRAYIFSAQLWQHPNRDARDSIHNLQLNTPALRELGASHLLSDVPIDSGFQLVMTFQDPTLDRELYLYTF